MQSSFLPRRASALWLGVTAAVAAMASPAPLLAAPAELSAAPPPAQEPAPAPEPGTLDSFFNGRLPDAIGRSRVSVNARLRYEHADQTGLRASDAFTLRTRFGLTTAPLHGFQGMIEGENITVIGPTHNFNAAGSNPEAAVKTVVADPPTTELNQAWLGYNRTNWQTQLRGGRQRLVLDNHRFVGDVGWRQNQQTFDAVMLENRAIEKLALHYSWVGRAHRVFGGVSGLPAAAKDFDSDSHLLNASYAAAEYAQVTGYAYLLDLENAAGANNSCATYGASITGRVPVREHLALNYRGEFAWQTDFADSTLDYSAPYYHVELGATVRPVTIGAGYEVLASDNGAAVRTPLATLHAFNGWADVFLNTPNAGLRDLYAFAEVTLPGAVPLRLVYHKFDADRGDRDFGQELDVVASRKLGRHWTLLAKYAFYDAQDAPFPPAPPANVQKVWAQLEFVF